MAIKKIISMIDFTGVSQLALEHTAIIARQSVCMVTLLHITDDGRQHEEKEIKKQIRQFAAHLEKEGISFLIQINYGKFFDVIADSIKALDSDLVVIGTHGIKGIKQNFVGSSICKLIRLITIPAFVIQGHSQPPHEGYTSILIPSLGIKDSDLLEKPVNMFATLFHSSLFFLTFHNKENEMELTQKTNQQAEKYKNLGFKTEVQLEETSSYMSSYSKSIVQFSDIEDIEVLLMVFHQSGESKYFDDEDLENILLNRFGKPVLCL